jgi:signal peptidase I
LIIDELSYRFRSVVRGEVVVFRYPLDPSQYYIKRVIGLPGETLEATDGRIKIYNQQHPLGFILDESKYLSPNVPTYGDFKQKIGDKEYFVMGDNRQSSFDSRRWGPVPAKNIIGRAWLRAWPPQTAQIFVAPEYSY